MTTPAPEVAHLLMALSALLLAAHAVGHAFVLMRQPRVIGELVGGLLLGPTLLGAVAPSLESYLFPTTGATASALGLSQQLGLFLLMFCSGCELRALLRRGDRRVVAWVTVAGLAVPFGAGALAFGVVGHGSLLGPAHNETALMLVFALAIAVTSIPVISRIMMDLGIIDTSFARVVLGVAVIEDVVVYVVLAIALGLVSVSQADSFGLTHSLGLSPGGSAALTVHTAVTLGFFALMLGAGGPAYRWSRRRRWNLVAHSNPIAWEVVFVFASTLVCLALEVTPMFGAFLAGIAVSSAGDPDELVAREAIKSFSMAYFIPVYFAIVGLQLDLFRDLDPLFFAGFVLFACLVKSVSVYAGARLGGESAQGAANLAVATNARGGPGIVLASVAFGAGIISTQFRASLVMLAVVTSMVAGAWLGRVVRSGRPLRPGRSNAASPAPAPAGVAGSVRSTR